MNDRGARSRLLRFSATWVGLLAVAGAGPHFVATLIATVMGDNLVGGTPFAIAVREHTRVYSFGLRLVAFPTITALYVLYWYPVVRWGLRGPRSGPAPAALVRRALSGPLLMAALGFAPWALAIVYFPAVTLFEFGTWSTELVSEQILTPLISGGVASTTAYLLLDAIVRSALVPTFGGVRLSQVGGTRTLGISARLGFLVFVVGFAPFFTLLGLIDAADRRTHAGVAVPDAFASLLDATSWVTMVFVVLGGFFTTLFAFSLTRPLRRTSAGLARVRQGDMDTRVDVDSADEIGGLAESVNDLADTLRERERILGAFGRIVEPAVRDRLLDGTLASGGKRATATVVFMDLKGYTSMAERETPEETVETLNAFFETMSSWVHDCGGYVDKFMGDAMLVCFGLFADPEAKGTAPAGDAAAAIRAVAGVHERLEALNAARRSAGRAALSAGIGVHTGEVVAGIVGAKDRHEYTVIGDAVNIAARLQEACRERGVEVLISQSVNQALANSTVASRLKPLGEMSIRGRSAPLTVYTLYTER